MNISRLFILRPIATLLLSIALTVVGAVSFRFLPVAPIPTVDMPVIFVQASLAGASPETMPQPSRHRLSARWGRSPALRN